MCRMGFEELRSTAEHQLGLVTWRQVCDEVGERTMRNSVASGWLVPVRGGVYRVAGTPMSWLHAVRGAVLAAGPEAWASHAAAAAVWGLVGFRRSSLTAIDVSVRRGRRVKLAGIQLHECRVLPVAHTSTVDS